MNRTRIRRDGLLTGLFSLALFVEFVESRGINCVVSAIPPPLPVSQLMQIGLETMIAVMTVTQLPRERLSDVRSLIRRDVKRAQ